MTLKFYIGLTLAVLIFASIILLAPFLRIKDREKRRVRLDDWYALGPVYPGENSNGPATSCSLCGGDKLKKTLFGTYERKELLKRLNPVHVDEARFYEYRCVKCSSLACKEKVLTAPSKQG